VKLILVTFELAGEADFILAGGEADW